VAARAEALGVARVVARDALTPETLAAAIREVLETPDYTKRARHHRERLHAESPASARVCELVTAFMSKSGAIEPG
jgi:UDP:flavonoid glycosyltransferase YjiC (YdhE family)